MDTEALLSGNTTLKPLLGLPHVFSDPILRFVFDILAPGIAHLKTFYLYKISASVTASTAASTFRSRVVRPIRSCFSPLFRCPVFAPAMTSLPTSV